MTRIPCPAAILMFLLLAPAPVAGFAATAPAAPSPAQTASGFESIELPDWVLLEPPPRERKQPWILIVDDPQCPYCMQLHLALMKERESEIKSAADAGSATGSHEISRALIARFPFPLPIHDQAAHIVTDALCFEATRDRMPWTAAGYLDWLMLDGWKEEPGWKTATLEELEKDGGFFDSNYDAHRVTSSRRREYQMLLVKKQADCVAGGCGQDADCEKLCAKQTECRAACPVAGAATAAPGATPAVAPGAKAGEPAEPPPTREECLADCRGQFQGARYRMMAREHSRCVLEEGEASAHGRTAAAFKWADDHDIPGTPTTYVGHPLIGWRLIGDSDDLEGFFKLLRPALADARVALGKALGRPSEQPK